MRLLVLAAGWDEYRFHRTWPRLVHMGTFMTRLCMVLRTEEPETAQWSSDSAAHQACGCDEESSVTVSYQSAACRPVSAGIFDAIL